MIFLIFAHNTSLALIVQKLKKKIRQPLIQILHPNGFSNGIFNFRTIVLLLGLFVLKLKVIDK